VRIALAPLDSRPSSWQFPLRIAQIAGDQLVSPPRELLGTLHKGADQQAMIAWLRAEAAQSDAVVISWDALAYGGLVQSREEGNPFNIAALTEAFRAIDWQRCKGYLWLTVPRLGMTVASQADWDKHKLIAQYFRVWGACAAEPNDEELSGELKAVEAELGTEAISQAWWLRRRNADYARDALQLSATLGFQSCHVAVEDNARTGPHLEEVAELRKLALELTAECRRDGREPPRFSFFDGTDECGSLLTARAILDERDAPPLPVRLTLFPSSPTPDKYFGLYESHSLEDGLLFLAKFLGFEYRAEGKVQWLVCFGKQPQPDVFSDDDPETIFASSYLVPPGIEGTEPLFLADLQGCNGGNPELLAAIAEMAGNRLMGVSAWNTNFNALGYSAATIVVACLSGMNIQALMQAMLERTADDYVYQSAVRYMLREEARNERLNVLDFSEAKTKDIEGLLTWANESVTGVLAKQCPFLYKVFPDLATRARQLRIGFPWQRLFEIEVSSR
jgi:hypothetical protein